MNMNPELSDGPLQVLPAKPVTPAMQSALRTAKHEAAKEDMEKKTKGKLRRRSSKGFKMGKRRSLLRKKTKKHMGEDALEDDGHSPVPEADDAEVNDPNEESEPSKKKKTTGAKPKAKPKRRPKRRPNQRPKQKQRPRAKWAGLRLILRLMLGQSRSGSTLSRGR